MKRNTFFTEQIQHNSTQTPINSTNCDILHLLMLSELLSCFTVMSTNCSAIMSFWLIISWHLNKSKKKNKNKFTYKYKERINYEHNWILSISIIRKLRRNQIKLNEIMWTKCHAAVISAYQKLFIWEIDLCFDE